jgi:tight adherence protein B
MPDARSRGLALDRLASVVERLSVLLSAGIGPNAAWRYIAEFESETDRAGRIVGSVSRTPIGQPIGGAILQALDDGARDETAMSSRDRRIAALSHDADDSAWRGLAAAWMVASEAGAPLSLALADFAASLRALAQSSRDATVALSGPVATARLVLALPAVGVLFGMALGFDTLGTLVTTVPGAVCLLSGCVLLLAARAWNRRLIASSQPRDVTPGLVLDLFAIAVSGGSSIDRARNAVGRAVERCGLSMREEDAELIVSLAVRAGVPAGGLLRSEAERLRRNAKSEADRRAGKLAVTLMMPLGLCVLPAFMLVGVAPLVLAVLSSTVSVF